MFQIAFSPLAPLIFLLVAIFAGLRKPRRAFLRSTQPTYPEESRPDADEMAKLTEPNQETWGETRIPSHYCISESKEI
jgi:hypothetical protein